MTNAPWAIAMFAVVVGPAVTYFVATRNASGRIATSEASDLWRESAEIRKYLAEQLAERDRAIKALEDENRELHQEINQLRRELEACK